MPPGMAALAIPGETEAGPLGTGSLSVPGSQPLMSPSSWQAAGAPQTLLGEQVMDGGLGPREEGPPFPPITLHIISVCAGPPSASLARQGSAPRVCPLGWDPSPPLSSPLTGPLGHPSEPGGSRHWRPFPVWL